MIMVLLKYIVQDLNPNPVTYYIGISLDSDKLVLRLINELLRTKYNNTTFYCHNLGRFDIIFILKLLIYFNDSKVDE